MASSSKKKLGCWFAKLLARKQSESALLPGQFGAHAQSALDSTSASTYPGPQFTVSNPAGSIHQGSLTRQGMTLADLKPGECGYIDHLAGTTKGRLRLLEMGMTPGIHVQVMRAAAFGGPLDVQIRGYQLSIRREEAALVWLGGQKETVRNTADFKLNSTDGQAQKEREFTEQDDLG